MNDTAALTTDFCEQTDRRGNYQEGSTYCVHGVVGPTVQEDVGNGSASDAFCPRHNGGLGQARGARGIDQNGHVGEGRLGPVGIRCPDGIRTGGFSFEGRIKNDKLDVVHLLLDLVANVGRNTGVNDA